MTALSGTLASATGTSNTNLKASLTGATGTSGLAHFFASATTGDNEFRLAVSGLTASSTYTVQVDGTTVGQLTTDTSGRRQAVRQRSDANHRRRLGGHGARFDGGDHPPGHLCHGQRIAWLEASLGKPAKRRTAAALTWGRLPTYHCRGRSATCPTMLQPTHPGCSGYLHDGIECISPCTTFFGSLHSIRALNSVACTQSVHSIRVACTPIGPGTARPGQAKARTKGWVPVSFRYGVQILLPPPG